jgi:hypothetical protein
MRVHPISLENSLGRQGDTSDFLAFFGRPTLYNFTLGVSMENIKTKKI